MPVFFCLTQRLQSCDWGRRSVRFVRLASVVTHNDGDFVDAILLYCETLRYSSSKERLDEACAQRHGVHNFQSCFFMITNHSYVTR